MTESNSDDRMQSNGRTFSGRNLRYLASGIPQILEDHRREIQNRLEKIEREIEKKSDKENVDMLARSIYSELRRHTEEIENCMSVSVRKWALKPCGR